MDRVCELIIAIQKFLPYDIIDHAFSLLDRYCDESGFSPQAKINAFYAEFSTILDYLKGRFSVFHITAEHKYTLYREYILFLDGWVWEVTTGENINPEINGINCESLLNK